MDNGDADENLSYVSDNNEEVVPETLESCERQPTPAVAEYTTAEIAGIVEFIKKMTILYMMDDNDWTGDCSVVVQTWLQSSDNMLLTIYYNSDVLTASQEFPSVPVYDCIYFLREPNSKFALDTFHDEVIFGRIHEDVEGTLLTLLEKLHAPILLNLSVWNANTRMYLACSFQTFLANMTRLHYMMSGIAVLYVPQQILVVSVDDALGDDELLKQVEMIAEHWITIFRTCLCDKTKISPYNAASLCDEYEFWRYRYEVLYSVQHQVQQKDLVHVLKILQKSQSTYTKPIDQLIEQIGFEKQAALNNICYLNMLIKLCDAMNSVEPITEAFSHLPKFIYTILYVNKRYLNSQNDASDLFCKLSNQIILYCQNRINVREALTATPSAAIKKANEAIDLCLYYKVIFSRIIKHIKPPYELNENSIFNYMNLFIRRLHDLIEICQGIIIFEQKNEDSQMNNMDPCFGGIRGAEFAECCANIKANFTLGLRSIREADSNLLDIHNSENGWTQMIAGYKTMVGILEETIENLIKNVFTEVDNVEEGIEALGALYYYSLRPKIRIPYMRRTIDVWHKLHDEIHVTNRLLLEQLHTRNSQIGKYGGRASDLASNRDRIARIRRLFEQAEWLPDYAYAEKVLEEHTSMDTKMTETVKALYDKWLDLNRTEAVSKLNRTLMIRSVTHPGLIECNISHDIFQIHIEAHYFKILGFGIPVHINQFYTRYSFKIVYDAVIKLLVDYNRILISMSEKERLLFRCLIQVCDAAFLPAVYRLTWNSEGLDAVTMDCTRNIEDLKVLVKIYREANKKIIATCEKIAGMCLVQLDPNHNGKTQFNNLVQKFKGHREENLLNVLRSQNFIAELLFLVLTGFEPYMANMAKIWKEYILKFDNLLLESLKICSRHSLERIYGILHWDGTAKQSFLLHVDLELNNQKLNMSPTVAEIFDFFGSIHETLKLSISYIPRLCAKVGVPAPAVHQEYVQLISTDAECNRLFNLIRDELKFNRDQVNMYMRQWVPFADIWELDKEIFLTKYKEIHSSFPLKELLSNFERYLDIINRIFFREITSNVQFLLVDCTEFKRGLYEEIHSWWTLFKSSEANHEQSD